VNRILSCVVRNLSLSLLLVLLPPGAYGSTERLEQNLQAILFDQQPRMPSRKAKDVLARVWQHPEEWTVSHRSFSVGTLLLLLTLVWQLARRRKGRRALPGV
jgi:hypothetical protein